MSIEIPESTLSLNHHPERSTEHEQFQGIAGAVEIVDERNIENITELIIYHIGQAEENYIEVGKLLIEAKKKLPHGQWLPWLRDNIEISAVTAQRFMRLAEEFSNASPVTHLGFTKASILITLQPEERDAFIEKRHEINGTVKSVEEMSKRELESVVRERKKTQKSIPAATESKKDFSVKTVDGNRSGTYVEQETDTPSDDAYNIKKEIEEARALIERILIFILEKSEDQDCDINQYEVAMGNVCQNILGLINSQQCVDACIRYVQKCLDGYENEMFRDYDQGLRKLYQTIQKTLSIT